MNKNNYDLVLEVIESYDNENVLNDFKSKFEVGKSISKKDYIEFCGKWIDCSSDFYYINLNWKYIRSGGDESVFDEVG